MKRKLAVILLLAVLASVIAGSGTVSAAPTITIKWWGYPLPWTGVTGKETLGMASDDPRRGQYTVGDWYVYVANQFMKENPDVKIEFELIDWSKGRIKVDTAVLGGSPPDLLGQENSDVLLRFALKGILEPIDSYLTKEDKADFLPAALNAGKYKNHYYYWPISCTAEAYQANMTIYKERGITDLLPTNDLRTWSFDQYLQALQKTTFDRNGDGVPDVYGSAVIAGEETRDFWRNVFLWGQGAKIFDRTGKKVNLVSKEAEAGLQLMLDLENKHKVVVPGSVTQTGAKVQNAWLTGKIAMTYAVSESINIIKASEAAGTTKPGSVVSYTFSPPSVAGVGPVPRSYSTGFAVFKQKDKAKRDAIMKFARYLTNTANNATIKAGFPIRKSVGDLYPGDEHMRFLRKMLDYPVKDSTQPYILAIRTILLPMYQAVLTKSKTPLEALKEANVKANQYMAQQLAQEKQ